MHGPSSQVSEFIRDKPEDESVIDDPARKHNHLGLAGQRRLGLYFGAQQVASRNRLDVAPLQQIRQCALLL